MEVDDGLEYFLNILLFEQTILKTNLCERVKLQKSTSIQCRNKYLIYKLLLLIVLL